MWIRAFFKYPACLAPVLCFCLVFHVLTRPVRGMQREGTEKPLSLTYENLRDSWYYTGEAMTFLDTGKVDRRTNTNPYESPSVFTDKPVTDGKGGFFLFKHWQTRYGERYEIADDEHIRIGDILYRAEITATTLTLTRRTERMEFKSFYRRGK